jgi:hypothetical protein
MFPVKREKGDDRVTPLRACGSNHPYYLRSEYVSWEEGSFYSNFVVLGALTATKAAEHATADAKSTTVNRPGVLHVCLRV